MMTSVMIDDDLLAQAARLTVGETPAEIVTEALRRFIEQPQPLSIADFRGTLGEVEHSDLRKETDNGFGCLAHLANPALRKQEKHAGAIAAKKKERRRLGTLEGRVKITFADDFAMTDEDLLTK